MTNEMIILQESIKLMEDGVLAPTDKKCIVKDKDGKDREMFLPEMIHTYQHWKDLGFQVRKGEKAVAKFLIWKNYIKENDNGEVEDNRMFMKKASFFKMSQVDLIENEKGVIA